MVRTAPESHADTRLFYIVHNTFRLGTNRMVDATEKLPASVLQPAIGSAWGFYAGVLDHHHHTEDTSILPALVAVRPDLQPLINDLSNDHRRLIEALEAVNAAVTAFERQPDAEHQRTLHERIVAVRDEFFPHLDVEDAQVIPAITESMPPKEWERLDARALKTMPKRYLPLAVGALDEFIQGLPEQERPPPPPLPIRLMLALSWRKKWAAWIKPLLV
ncbi:MAG TPA: hemerythrin domain-containing protein [Acidimicrobiales bacterium]|nr:hemerythrin domain-containing protein [Acidimicrobiales bacterium]